MSADAWETPCPVNIDGVHCQHWYDAAACCGCGAPAESKCPRCFNYLSVCGHDLSFADRIRTVRPSFTGLPTKAPREGQ